VRQPPPFGSKPRAAAATATRFSFPAQASKLGFVELDGENRAMSRKLLVVAALALWLPFAGRVAMAGAVFLGPGPGLTGNDTGGIISYSPDLEKGVYREMATNWCARWDRLSHVTSVHRRYGDYVSFVCIDRLGMIH
jgi:hypothetical protein